MDLSLDRPEGYLFVRRVESAVVTLGDRQLQQSFLLAPDQVEAWEATAASALDATQVEPIMALQPEVVLLGTGDKQVFPAAEFMAGFLRRGVGIEVMDNSAAARTYNLLAGEGRRVVAGFILERDLTKRRRATSSRAIWRRWTFPPATSAWRQIVQRIDRIAILADLELQFGARSPGGTHLRHRLAGTHPLALLHQTLAVVTIGGQKAVVVLDDDQLAIADQSVAAVNHHAIGRRPHRLAGLAGNLDPGDRVGILETLDDAAIRGPAPAHATHGTRAPC